MQATRPNVLLITTDQHHHSAIGGETSLLRTEALSRLTREGTQFNRAYCNNPLCSPSRASIITGQYPSVHGCWTNGVALPEDSATIGGLLAKRGYQTSLLGKAHFQPLVSSDEQPSLEAQPTLRDLEFWRQFSGPFYGFQTVELARNHADESHAGQHYALWLEKKGLANWRDYFRPVPQGPPAPPDHEQAEAWSLPADLHYTTWTADRTIAAIERAVAAGEPFLTWASFQDPHPPYLVPEPYASMYDPADIELPSPNAGEFAGMAPWFARTQESDPDFSSWQETDVANQGFHSHLRDEATLRRQTAVYYGMITMVDRQIGRVLAALDDLGVASDTIVVFTADHGHFLGQHGLTDKGPFHYEDLIRVPFLVRHPGHVPAGVRSDALTGLVDLAPTVLSAAGADVPMSMQGVDQLAVWRGEVSAARDEVIIENRHQPSSIHLRTMVEGRFKLTVYRGMESGELFDLANDPQELRNLFFDPAYEEVRSSLMLRFIDADLRREPLWRPRVSFA